MKSEIPQSQIAEQLAMFERQEAWLIEQWSRPRLSRKRQRELNLRTEQHIRDFDRFVESHGGEVRRKKSETPNRKPQSR